MMIKKEFTPLTDRNDGDEADHGSGSNIYSQCIECSWTMLEKDVEMKMVIVTHILARAIK